ncbi:MAG: AbrB/MazE/SpoVT family DNA-binding domain-containing protein [Azoarcus sp.]|jgi:antitoxin MazE|nr:AbrB/MazE/SpoVT family DNA-binding domain-containing protein [Azoarcus sp.]
MRLAKWGTSLAVRIPAAVVRRMNLREGDEVDIELVRRPSASSVLNELRQFRGRMPAGYRFDREDANGR